MADDFDVEAMLEEPYKQKTIEEPSVKSSSSSSKRRSSREKESDRDREKRHRSRSRDRERKRSSDRDRHKDKERRSSRDRDRDSKRSSKRDDDRKDRDKHRDRSRDRDRKRDSSRDKDRKRDSSRDKDRKRDSSRDKDRKRDSRDKDDHKSHRRDREGSSRHRSKRSVSPVRPVEPDLTPEERDARTIFCMQLAARIRPRDLEEFFSAVGKVKDVRLITDNKSHRSKGIAYIEFQDIDSVALAIGLSGQKLLGVPIIVQPSHAERNRMASAQAVAMRQAATGPMRLYIGSLHYNISEEMLRGIFEPFGRIDDLRLMKDSNNSNRSAGYGFITFSSAEDAKKAMDQLNGFELAGRPMKVSNITDHSGGENSRFDADEVERHGFDLGATGRLHLMAKLAEGTGMQIPQAAANVLGSSAYGLSSVNQAPPAVSQTAAPPIPTTCFMLSNMFDPAKETSTTWEVEVKDDVIAECNKHGGVVHIFVDRASPTGNVYVKCPTMSAAAASVNSLHGRYFGGKVITAAYVPLENYTALFPDSASTMQLVMPSGGLSRAG